MPDVLDALFITKENRIEKPGKVTVEEMRVYKEKQNEIRYNYFQSLSVDEKLILAGMERKLKNHRIRTDKHINKTRAAKRNSKEINRNKQQHKGMNGEAQYNRR